MKFFNHRAGVVGEKNFTFRHSLHLGDSPLSPGGGGGVEKICVNCEIRGACCRLYIFLGVREASSKTIKTGLNCRQVSKEMSVCLNINENILYYSNRVCTYLSLQEKLK